MSDNQLANITNLENDNLLAFADQAEKRIDAINRIKLAALKVTNAHDWVDQGGKPYLQASGGEKVARLFGISWRIDEPQLTISEDGHFEFVYKGYFALGNSEIEAIGTRESKDDFFTWSGKKSPSEIDRGDVRKAAYTNCIANGVTRILGIRNMTWDDLKTAGIDREKAGKVDYKKTEVSPEAKTKLDDLNKMLMQMANNNAEKASLLLEGYTSFVNSSGKTVPGKKALTELSEKMIPVTHGKVKKDYDEWKKGAAADGSGEST